MRNFVSAFFATLSVMLLCGYTSQAQYSIKLNGSATNSKLCMGPFGSSVTLQLVDGSGNPVSPVDWYVDAYQSIVPQSATGPYSVGGGCGPILSLQKLYGANTTSAYWYGNVTVYALNPASNCFYTSRVMTVYPQGSGSYANVTGAITGSPDIYAGTWYSLSSTNQFSNGATGLSWSVATPALPTYYTLTPSGNSVYVVPKEYAPLTDHADIMATFTPAGSPCDAATSIITTTRHPYVTSNAPNNILCSGSSATLSVNISDATYYPSIPTDHNLDHFTYQWYLNGSAISGATSQTYNATVSGSYYVTINEYPQEYVSSAWQWGTTPVKTENSNTVVINSASTTTPTSAFTINGLTPATSAPGTNLFNCKPITFANTSTGTINYYKIRILDGNNPATQYYSSGDIYAAPPASLDLRTMPAGTGNATILGTTAGAYAIELTTSPGCPTLNTSVKKGYIYVNVPATNLTVVTTATTMASTTQTYNTPGVHHVGRFGTVFNWMPTFGANTSVCGLKLTLYKVDTTTAAVWSTTYTALSCSPTAPTQKPLSLIGGGGFFGNPVNAPNNSVWALKAVATNDCGDGKIMVETFMIDDANYQRQVSTTSIEQSENALEFVPIPFGNEVNAHMLLAKDAKVSMEIYSIDGKLMQRVWNDEDVVQGRNDRTINTATWPAGMYFYKVHINDAVYSGKLVKE